MLEHKSGNISETRKDRGKVALEGLQELTNALSNGTVPDPLRPRLPQDWGSQPHPKHAIALSQERLKLYKVQIWPEHSQGPSEPNIVDGLIPLNFGIH